MWAADHSFSENSDEAEAGFEALEALQSPLWEITEQETAFISTLTRDPINEFTDFERTLPENSPSKYDRPYRGGNDDEG
jgi:hypothetical protein